MNRGRPSAAAGVALLLIGTALLVRLPLVGAWLAGHPPSSFEEPLADLGYVRHAPFSWWAFMGLSAVALVVAAALLRQLVSAPRSRRPPTAPRGLVWWGWLGLAWTAAWWFVAWTPLEGWTSLRTKSFTPLWLGYVAVVNALALRHRGSCLLSHPRFVALTAVSAVFWWVFEYLNRFVESWAYHGVDLASPIDLVWYAVLPFATVLPAVASTQHLLAGHAWLEPFERWHPVALRRPRVWAAIAIAVAVVSLALLSPGASYLFPFLWVAPLAAAVAALTLAGRDHCLSDLRRGDWRLVLSYGTAAVITGFFWEMWNYQSWPRWTYRVPFVGGIHIFEMPLLGYFGYVPFGLECATVAALVGIESRTFDRSGVG